MLDNYSNEPPETLFLFCNYDLRLFADGLPSCEYPIILTAPSFQSNLGRINVRIPSIYDLQDLITDQRNDIVQILYSENYLLIQNSYAVPYVVCKLKDLPDYLFITLFYPEEEYFTQLSKYSLLPNLTLSFYDVDSTDKAIGHIDLTSSNNWLEIYRAIQKNPSVSRKVFNGIINNFGFNAIVEFLSENYL